MKVKIYQPTKNAMQSGKRALKYWLLEPIIAEKSRFINPLMGWTSSLDTKAQLRLSFSNKEEAIKYAVAQGFEYEIKTEHQTKIQKKSYASNFTAPLV